MRNFQNRAEMTAYYDRKREKFIAREMRNLGLTREEAEKKYWAKIWSWKNDHPGERKYRILNEEIERK